VRVEHLSLAGGEPPVERSAVVGRQPRGAGSVRELRPGVWKVVITDGTTAAGRPRRRSRTVHSTRADAEGALARLRAGVRRDLGDLLVRELVGRHLDWLHADATSPAARSDRHVLHQHLEPSVGTELAAELTPADVERALRAVYLEHGADTARRGLGLLRDAYRWALGQGWCDANPTEDITVRRLR
jgi:hypothetical protein